MEVVGSVAAAAQLAELGCRSLFSIYRFIKDLQDVPNDLLLTLQDLSRFVELMADLRPDDSSINRALRTLPKSQLDRITRIFNCIGDVCTELEELLAPCLPTASRSIVKRAWRALISVNNESAIVKKCERLERLKQDLSCELQLSVKYVKIGDHINLCVC